MWHDIVIYKFHVRELPDRVAKNCTNTSQCLKNVYHFVLAYIHSYSEMHTGHELDTRIRGSSFTLALMSAMDIYNVWAMNVMAESHCAFDLFVPWLRLTWLIRRRIESVAVRENCAKADEGAVERPICFASSTWRYLNLYLSFGIMKLPEKNGHGLNMWARYISPEHLPKGFQLNTP